MSNDKQATLAEQCARRIHRIFGAARQRHETRSLPEIAVVLGSGFQPLLGALKIRAEVQFRELPGFPVPRVEGHQGRFLLAELNGLPMLVLSGRAHYYEGHEMETIMFPTRVLGACGVRELILTNAAGAINREFRRGDFMIASDHINFTGVNPLRGLSAKGGNCFVDLSETYCPRLRQEFCLAAKQAGIRLRQGVYLGVSGPSYETPAEIRAFRKLGADAVGMSTIPEAVMARFLQIRVAAISCITNPAAGMAKNAKLTHQEVLHEGERSTTNAARLLSFFARGRL